MSLRATSALAISSFASPEVLLNAWCSVSFATGVFRLSKAARVLERSESEAEEASKTWPKIIVT